MKCGTEGPFSRDLESTLLLLLFRVKNNIQVAEYRSGYRAAPRNELILFSRRVFGVSFQPNQYGK